MPSNPMNAVLRRLRRAVSPADVTQRTDAQLLADYASGHAEAFEVLVRRHARMVLGVCRRALGNDHDAEDAFQATFLILARKAGAVGWQDSVSPWLHGVAIRTARNARVAAERRRRREEVVATMTRDAITTTPKTSELGPILDEEMDRLPAKYRQSLVLCYLEGHTNEEAARQMQCPAGTLKVHLMRARDLLRSRLAGRGVPMSAVALAALLEAQASAAEVPDTLLGTTLNAAERFAAGSAASATSATAIAEGVLREMFLTKVKTAAVTMGAILVVGLGLSLSVGRAEKPESASAPPVAAKDGPTPTPEAATKPPVKKARPAVKAEDAASLVKGNNDFAFDLYPRLLEEKKGNLFFSPYSVSTALGMTYAGARGETAEEMAKALHFTLPQDRLHTAAGAQIDLFNGVDGKPRGYKLAIANALWGQQGFVFKPEFLKLNDEAYGAGVTFLNFGDAERARTTINTWVENKTEDKIKELIKPGILDGSTKLVLTNAIYFKGDWEWKFKKEHTKEADFQVSAEMKVTVPLMHRDGTHRYFETPQFQLLELPYAGKDVSMLIYLPRKADGLPEFEKGLTSAFVDESVKKLDWRQEVQVRLPRFKTRTDAELVPMMQKLGMRKAFGGADFSGISNSGLSISNIIHQAYVDVNEEGTEAAAATAVVMKQSKEPIYLFRADHPFIFLIRDNKSGSVLFVGRIANPAAAE